jgi:hypothetical protein
MRRVVSVFLPHSDRPAAAEGPHRTAPPRDKPLLLAAMDRQRRRKALQLQPRDIYVLDLHINTIKVKARNFR